MQSPFSFHRPVRCGRAWRIGLVMTLLACSCAPEMPGSPARPTRPVGIASDATSPAGISDQIVVTLAPGADPEVLANDYGATLVSASEGFATLRFSGDLVLADGSPSLAGDARVLSAEPDAWLESPETRQESFAFDDGLGSEATYLEQPAAAAIGLPAAHLISTGRDVRVAILDTGADLSHPALAGRIAGGWDFVSGDADPTDTPDGVDNDE